VHGAMTPQIAGVRAGPDAGTTASRSRSAALIEAPQPTVAVIALWAFVVIPFVALLAAVPVAWGWGLSYLDLSILAVGYVLAGFGITVGFHRYLTHGAFKANRRLRIVLVVAGSLAIEGSATQWVADHRRHHAFSDRDGDPHSPWRYGQSIRGLAKGLFFAHCGWLLKREPSNRARFAPDLLADPDIQRIDRVALPLIGFSLLAPAPPTSGHWRCCRSGRAGTTPTTPTQPVPATAYCPDRSTRPPD
jgi:stearoyl-CoA desaturase (Delta-9 desaturase)